MPAQLQYLDCRHSGQIHVLGREPTVIGGRAAAIKVPGSTVTRRHARVYRDAGRFWIEDLGGDGVWINGARIERSQLTNRDRIRVGSLELQYWED
jgi:pSer/pThr/pTyr-binding forkhead associated (FHA) protein